MMNFGRAVMLSVLVALPGKAAAAPSECRLFLEGASPPGVSRAQLEHWVGTSELDFVEFPVDSRQVNVNGLARISVTRQRDSHQELRTRLRQQSSTVLGVKRMFYPAAGVDSATPFMILPGLQTAVAIDDDLFANRHIKRTLRPDFGPSDALRGFTWVGNFKSYDDVVDILVGRLLVHVPNVRIRQVVGFGPRRQNRVSNSLFLPHGYVVFDQGEGTPIRSYVHLNEAGSPFAPVHSRSSGIFKRLSYERFDVVLRKAAMEFFDSAETEAEIQRLLTNLISNRGLWIDGDSMENDGENLSQQRRNLIQMLSDWGLQHSIKVTQTDIDGFGYGHVGFVRFGPDALGSKQVAR